jgi:hypothetical protein
MDLRTAVEKKAYELFENNGCISGFDLDHWLEAERIIYAGFPSATNDKLTMPAKSAEKENEPMKVAAKTTKTRTTDKVKRAATKKVKAK